MAQTVCLAIALLCFYGSHAWAWLAQRRRGVDAAQLGRNTSGAALWVERFVGLATVVALAGQVASLVVSEPVTWDLLGWAGVALAWAGVALFVAAQVTLGASWRAGVPASSQEAGLEEAAPEGHDASQQVAGPEDATSHHAVGPDEAATSHHAVGPDEAAVPQPDDASQQVAAPKEPAEGDALVTRGIFRWTRNPAFLGFWFLYAGFVIALPSWWMTILAVLAADALYLQVRVVEEPFLVARYGGAYQTYCRTVARWLGRGWGWRRGLWRAFDVLLALGVVVAMLLALYSSDYYRAGATAATAMEGTAQVTVSQRDGLIVFQPEDVRAGLVFYPGAKVDPEAYAPLMDALAEKGFLCVVPRMPLNLAVMDPSAAEDVQERFPEVSRWYLAGHSLGGSMAAAFLSGQLGRWDGLALLASYSTEDLGQVPARDGGSLTVVSIYGSEDGVLSRDALGQYEANLPEGTRTLVVQGGNHAQFGDYGEQAGDGAATVTAPEQVQQTADAIAEAFLGQ